MELGPERERALIVRSCGTGLVKLNELSSIFSVLKKKKKKGYMVFSSHFSSNFIGREGMWASLPVSSLPMKSSV